MHLHPLPAFTDNYIWLLHDGRQALVVDPGQAGFTSEEMRVALAEQNIESRPLWKPMHLQPVFAGAPAVVDGTAERMFRTGLSLPSGSALTDAQLDRVMGAILAFVRGDRGRG